MAVIRGGDQLDYAEQETEPWDEPELEDFGVEKSDMEELPERKQDEIRDNFMVTVGDGDDFADQKVPVVDPEGDLDPSNDALNKNALDNAEARAGQVDGISAAERRELEDEINELQGLF